jgi:chloramphenicol-sensitive protein RarD
VTETNRVEFPPDASGNATRFDTGVPYAIAAYAIWGMFPLYWHQLQTVPSLQVIAHRIIWSCVAVVVLVFAVRGRSTWPAARVVALYAVAAVLIGVNWFLYVWGVNADLIVQTSLGYFMTPLVNVLMGVVILRERLRAAQWISVAIAAAGVVYLTNAYGQLPLLSFGLALTFGSYGLLKKRGPLPALEGLALETSILLLPAVIYLVVADRQGGGAFLRTGPWVDALLILGGPVTLVPLLLFGAAVQRVRLSVIGITQYIAPTIQFLLGVFVMREPFTRTQLVGFVIVWIALVIYVADALWPRKIIDHALIDSAGPS